MFLYDNGSYLLFSSFRDSTYTDADHLPEDSGEFNNGKYEDIDHIINCQRTGTDLFYRNVKSRKINKNFFPRDLLSLMEQNPIFYFGSNT